ncbi:NADPH quinone reductase [Rhizoctonia solani]|uniref:NADPH quinone reductase n=1 Tax=Rhizoctonia solani TaxID=456999 RepID=A0A8H7M9R0_9AGAM|nr:NADPH quinone reductase [Rhizoctonia solani]
MTLSHTMKAVTVQKGKKVTIEDVPVPALEPNEVLIRVHSVAQNPTDWKHTDFVSPVGNIIGCDFSGTVVKLGSDSINRVKVGDTVAGFVHGGNYKDRGAFAQYTRADSDLYRDADVVAQIQRATGNSLKFAFDTISEENTQITCVKSLTPAPEGTTPGKVVVVLSPNKEAEALRKDVVIQGTLLYTALGRPFEWPKIQFPASPEDRAHMASWMPKLEELAAKGQIKPNPVRLWPGGLEAVNEGFQYMREGKVSAEKIVYNIG